MSRIFITGDTHGDIDFHKLNSKNFPQGRELTKEDYVIVCGDFGICWDGSAQDKYLREWYENKPWTTLFVDGNHENFFLLNQYPEEDFFGGKVHRISPSIIHLKRGEIFTLNGKTFFVMGGASSIDKLYRQTGISWWEEEIPSYQEFLNGQKNLDLYNNKVDIILTHTAPTIIHQQTVKSDFGEDSVNHYLQMIFDSVEFDNWFIGHYHCDKNFLRNGNKIFPWDEGMPAIQILYDQIIELK